MTKELIRTVRVIHHLERSIHVMELVRDRTQQSVNQAIAMRGRGAAETNPTVAKARAYIAAYNRAILGAKAQINELERGD